MGAARILGLGAAVALLVAALVQWHLGRARREAPTVLEEDEEEGGVQLGEGVGGGVEPHFVLCENEYGKPCTSAARLRWLADFYGPLGRRVGEVTASGRTPAVVHVGAATFGDDVTEYRPLLEAVRWHGRTRLVLVEPEMERRDELLKVHKKLGMKAKDVTVVSAAMHKECNESMVQYVFSDQLFLDFVDPPELYASLRSCLRTWRSFTKDHLLRSVYLIGTDDRYVIGEGSSKDRDNFHTNIVPIVRRIHQAGNVSEYIQEEECPCFSPAQLMAEADLRPSDIVMLTVDAEGFDIPILSGFTGLEGFRPIVQRWEGVLAAPEHEGMARWFLESGYRIGVSGYSHARDIVAVLRTPRPSV